MNTNITIPTYEPGTSRNDVESQRQTVITAPLRQECEYCQAALDGPYCGQCGHKSGNFVVRSIPRVRIVRFASILL